LYDAGVNRKHRGSNGSKHAVSIQDVADEAKVSIATVSRVLNNPKLVAPDTSERVNAAIERLGYVPNAFAQGLITRASRMLGIALPDIHGEFYSELLRGADAEARRRNYHLLVSSDTRVSASPARGRRLAFGLVDGLAVMITEPNDRVWREARDLHLPVVVMDFEVDEPNVDMILVDNTVGTREAVEHLLSSVGGDRLYFVGGPRENFDTQRRASTFAKTLRERGVQVRDDHVAYGEYSVRWGQAWAREMGTSLRGVGVLAGNDEIALGILHGTEDMKLCVPRDVKIVGFDDTRIASLVRPTMSTVRVPLAEVGSAAVAALVERVENPERPGVKIRLDTKLIVRESSGGGK
jgi:LacI family transcriptional regulator